MAVQLPRLLNVLGGNQRWILLGTGKLSHVLYAITALLSLMHFTLLSFCLSVSCRADSVLFVSVLGVFWQIFIEVLNCLGNLATLKYLVFVLKCIELLVWFSEPLANTCYWPFLFAEV